MKYIRCVNLVLFFMCMVISIIDKNFSSFLGWLAAFTLQLSIFRRLK